MQMNQSNTGEVILPVLSTEQTKKQSLTLFDYRTSMNMNTEENTATLDFPFCAKAQIKVLEYVVDTHAGGVIHAAQQTPHSSYHGLECLKADNLASLQLIAGLPKTSSEKENFERTVQVKPFASTQDRWSSRDRAQARCAPCQKMKFYSRRAIPVIALMPDSERSEWWAAPPPNQTRRWATESLVIKMLAGGVRLYQAQEDALQQFYPQP